MPFYSSLNPTRPEDRRTAEGLLRLKQALDDPQRGGIPAKRVDTNLLLATWNLREFGGKNKGGTREREELFYLAEVMSRFDLIAVQEVRGDMGDLDRLMQVLGSWWRYLVTDLTYGRPGNSERVAFIYDQRTIYFGGLAGEVVPEPEERDQATGLSEGGLSFSRTPYLAGFRAGWFKFSLCSTHLYYGEGNANVPQRAREMEELVRLLKKRMDSPDRWARNTILLGDFNIFDASEQSNDPTFKALRTAFKKPAALTGEQDHSNAGRSKPYDQIAFLARDVELQLATARAGVFDFYQHVFRDEEAPVYADRLLRDTAPPGAAGRTPMDYATWRTFKMSDHLPKWVEVGIDFGAPYLKDKAVEPPRRPAAPARKPRVDQPARRSIAKR